MPPPFRLSSDQRKRLAKERACVHIFNWLQERLPFLQEMIPLMVGRAHDTFILGAFVRLQSSVEHLYSHCHIVARHPCPSSTCD